MKQAIAITLLLAVGAFAGGHSEVDIVPRSVNFLIFAGLIYYLLANPLKRFFGGRRETIADAFEKIQERLKSAKEAREQAASQVETARSKAEEILKTARSEADLLEAKIRERVQGDLKVLHKQKEENMEVARNQMIREVVTETVGEILSSADVAVDDKSILETLTKKVA